MYPPNKPSKPDMFERFYYEMSIYNFTDLTNLVDKLRALNVDPALIAIATDEHYNTQIRWVELKEKTKEQYEKEMKDYKESVEKYKQAVREYSNSLIEVVDKEIK